MASTPAVSNRVLTAGQAAAQLGIKKATLYAYVSRGQLDRHVDLDGKTSLFAAGEVERLLAQRRRGRPANTAIDISVTTALTHISEAGVWYRGLAVDQLIGSWTFEQTAEWLWFGDLGRSQTTARWPTHPIVVPDLGQGHKLGVASHLVLLTALTAAADTGPRGVTNSVEQSADIGRRLIATFADHGPGASEVALRPLDRSIAARVAARVTPRQGSQVSRRVLVPLIDTALILLADHDLASSTLAARIAASTRATGYGAVASGLGVLGGPLHGGASRNVMELLADIDRNGVLATIDQWRADGHRIPGFGHKIYRGTDPRFVILMREVANANLDLTIVNDLIALMDDRRGLRPNIDLALGALMWRCGLTADTGEFLFGVARTAGWIAHAIEEYQEAPLRFRPRSVYVAPRPTMSS